MKEGDSQGLNRDYLEWQKRFGKRGSTEPQKGDGFLESGQGSFRRGQKGVIQQRQRGQQQVAATVNKRTIHPPF